ncbi:LysR substrate binding domain protein [compost metagenome]
MQVSISVGQRFLVDATPALHSATLAGLGIAMFTALTVQEGVRAGRLIRVLPDWHAGYRGYFAIYPHTRALAPKVSALVNYLIEYYAERQIALDTMWRNRQRNLQNSELPR